MGSSRIISFFIVLCILCNVECIRRFRRPPLPPRHPVVKVGKEVISLNLKPAQRVDIAPLLKVDEPLAPAPKSPARSNLYILRRKTPRRLSGFSPKSSVLTSRAPTILRENRRSFNVESSNSANKWLALQIALRRQRQRDLLKSQYYDLYESQRKSQYLRSIVPLLYHYKLQKNAADKYYSKYLKTLQLLALATSATQQDSNALFSPELGSLTQSFTNSIYGSLLNNSTFVATNPVEPERETNTTSSRNSQQDASERSDDHHIHVQIHDPQHDEFTSIQREIEKEKRKLLDVFPPPQSEVPFGERTILMVRFPPVPKEKKGHIDITIAHDIDGGITFGGPRWFSFGKPFDPFDHPWYHEHHHKEEEHHHKPKKYVLAEAEKQSSNGVIISQNFIYRPSIRFTNSDPKHLAKYKGDPLNGGPSIVAQLAKALAEGNRISNSYFLSKNNLGEKKWANPEKKPPFVIVHLDTYTKKSNDTGALGIEEDVEANYANGTIIYPTENDPHLLASTKFEFQNVHEIEHIFDKPLAILAEHGWGWGEVPVHPKGINEIKNFLRLMYKVHQQSHNGGRKKIQDLRKLGDAQKKPAFPDSKPLLKDQIPDRSTTWLHTSSVGIRSLSEYDDQFPYDNEPVIDVSKDYSHYG